MRNGVRIFLLGLALLLSAGCMVLDEVDAANAKMNSPGKSAKKAQAAEASPGTPARNPVLEQSKKWWKNASSLGSDSLDSRIVSCRIDGATNFMARDDCLSRGGTVKGV